MCILKVLRLLVYINQRLFVGHKLSGRQVWQFLDYEVGIFVGQLLDVLNVAGKTSWKLRRVVILQLLQLMRLRQCGELNLKFCQVLFRVGQLNLNGQRYRIHVTLNKLLIYLFKTFKILFQFYGNCTLVKLLKRKERRLSRHSLTVIPSLLIILISYIVCERKGYFITGFPLNGLRTFCKVVFQRLDT